MLKEFLNNSYLFGGNAPFIEELYEAYLADPGAVPEEWRKYFDKLQLLPGGAAKDVAHRLARRRGQQLQALEVLAPLRGHRLGILQPALVELLDERRIAAEQVGVREELFHHGRCLPVVGITLR